LSQFKNYVAVQLGRDPRGVSLEEKRRNLAKYNQLLLDFDPRIQTTMVRMSDRFGSYLFCQFHSAPCIRPRNG
jgi:TldD protein